MSNSPLAVNNSPYSPWKTNDRSRYDRITPHCIVGEFTLKGMKDLFTSPDRVSCNYGIAGNGDIQLVVDETERAWTSKNPPNDRRAITIECSSINVPKCNSEQAFNDNVWKSLVNLCTDICKRRGKNKLIWISDKNTALAYQPRANEMQLTVHRWFSSTICPGNWLMARMDTLAQEVTNRLQGDSGTSTPTPAPTTHAPAFPLPSGWYFGPK